MDVRALDHRSPFYDLSVLERREFLGCGAKQIESQRRSALGHIRLTQGKHPLLMQARYDLRGRAFCEQACGLKLEGIISKQADAPYAPGNRGLWLKVKCLNREEFVVVGWTA